MNVIFNYGTGNIGSILNLIKKIDSHIEISDTLESLLSADRILFPGVGSFDTAMNNLLKKGEKSLCINAIIQSKIPLLGICLGMQLLTQSSEEGTLPGLGLIPATTRRFNFPPDNLSLKIPHMGWNTVSLQKDCILFDSMDPEAEFYFSHSYHLEAEDPSIVVGTTHYGYDFPSVIQKDNIYAVQFHPEKSHKYGKKVLQNFLELT